MGRGFRWFLGLLVIAGSIWLAVRVERSGSLEAQLLERVDAVGYCDSLGGTESPVYDSTLYTSRPYMRMSDGSMTENQRCPVRQSTLNVRVQPVFVNGRAIGFCWTPCVTVFVQDPHVYLNNIEIEVNDFLDSTRPAIMDAEHRSVVNYESFFFADLENKTRFDSNTVRYVELLTDPVSLDQFKPGDDSPRSIHNERQYYFVSDSTKAVFDADPFMYAFPMYQMRERQTH